MSVGPVAARGVLGPWTLLVCLSVAATILATGLDITWRSDLALYDAGLAENPAPADIVIVGIDDPSLAVLGRWPWRRALHASLLDRLRAAGASAVALDLILTEPDAANEGDDEKLAAALRRGPPTVLPLIVEMRPSGEAAEVLPIPELTGGAARLGHVQLEIDRDGIARSVFLREGVRVPRRSHLMLALLESLPFAPKVPLPGTRGPDSPAAASVWVRDYQVLIPFLGPPGHFKHYSYVDVLEGRVEKDAFRGKLVLVGMTAQGLGDAYPTPRSGNSVAMSGVEINANVLSALRSGSFIQRVPIAPALALSSLAVILACLGFLRLTPRESLIWVAVLWIGTLAGSVLMMRLAHWWWPPSTTLAVLTVLYPLWSWWRLEVTQRYLEAELVRFSSEPLPLLGTMKVSTPRPRLADVIQDRIDVFHQAAERVRDMRELLAIAIRAIPDATVVVDLEGRLVLANASAAALFSMHDESVLEGRPLDDHLLAAARSPLVSFDELQRSAPCTLEIRFGAREQDLLVRAVPFFTREGQRMGTLVNLVDISELRAGQRDREDVVRFLSHDLKSPASSLLGLAQLQRDPQTALHPGELGRRLDALAHRTLDLLDSFIALAQAEAIDATVFCEVDFRDVLQDANDELWAMAEARGVQIKAELADRPLMVRGDRQLLARALINLINNAIKFSPFGSCVDIRCNAMGALLRASVADEGPGVPADSRDKLFQRYFRGNVAENSAPKGAGLGLALVRVAAEKHSGSVRLEHTEIGACFVLELPLLLPAITDA